MNLWWAKTATDQVNSFQKRFYENYVLDLDDFTWPLLKWAGGSNDKYFAKLGTSKNQEGMISVYETPDMVPSKKKSFENI